MDNALEAKHQSETQEGLYVSIRLLMDNALEVSFLTLSFRIRQSFNPTFNG